MNSKTKGKVGEREFASLLREHGYEAKRGQQNRGGDDTPDVITSHPWHFEVKRVQRLDLLSACAQAKGDAQGKPWAVVHRRNRSPWLVTMPAEAFFDLSREAGL